MIEYVSQWQEPKKNTEPKSQPRQKQGTGRGRRATTSNIGTSAIQASGQRLRSGKEIMRSIEESKATPQSASDGVSQRMRVANPEIRVAGSSEGVATASCIGAEFIKSLI